MAKKKAKAKKSDKEKKYIATTGGNYEDVRFEKGDTFSEKDFPPKNFKAYVQMGVLVEVE